MCGVWADRQVTRTTIPSFSGPELSLPTRSGLMCLNVSSTKSTPGRMEKEKWYPRDTLSPAQTSTTPSRSVLDQDFTLACNADHQVEATGLSASTWYSYQFSNCANPENKSPIGKTRTAPGKLATEVATQRFAIYSCSNYPK